MITDADVKKLVKEFKKIFATKDDLKRFATKADINGLGNEIKSVKKDLTSKIEDLDEKIDKIYVRLAEDIGNVMIEIKGKNGEIRTHRIQIGEHEDRLQKVELKVFPQT